ncbi:MAG: hypothetical protein QMD13_08010 [Candidatus Bathyarchaeia archaeon]|nr:hypothetical protein [Candidatus Bathyarchaeia archaeon]
MKENEGKIFGFWAPGELSRAIDEYCRKNSMTKSEWLRWLVRKALKEHKYAEPVLDSYEEASKEAC